MQLLLPKTRLGDVRPRVTSRDLAYLEQCGRHSLWMASNLDWALDAVNQLATRVRDRCQELDSSCPAAAHLEDMAGDLSSLCEFQGRVLVDLVNHLITENSTVTNLRRESFLSQMSPLLSQHDLGLLYTSSLTGKELFDPDTLDSVVQRFEHAKKAHTQESMTSAVVKLANAGHKRGTVPSSTNPRTSGTQNRTQGGHPQPTHYKQQSQGGNRKRQTSAGDPNSARHKKRFRRGGRGGRSGGGPKGPQA